MVLYIDGGCTGNNQRDFSLRTMLAVVTSADGTVLSEQTAVGGSNNIAELMAARDALQWCLAHGVTDARIRTDSMNTLAWVNGTKVGKGINDRATVLRLKEEIAQLRRRVRATLTWVPRDDNVAGQYIERQQATP